MPSSLLCTVLVVLVLCHCYTTVQGTCPGGWQHFNESCYSFVRQERTWNNAEVHCIRRGARLAKIRSNEENEYVRNYVISNARYFSGFDLWLGGNKDFQGNWNWVDGTPLLEEGYSDWQPGEPDSARSQRNFCLELESDYGYRWSDDNCDDLNFSICERPFEPLTPPPLPVG